MPGEDVAALTVHASPAKLGAATPGVPVGLMSHVGRAPTVTKHSPGAARAGGKGSGSARAAPAPEVKVVVGNKQMLALEGVAVPQAVDEWMREREVRAPNPDPDPDPDPDIDPDPAWPASGGGRADGLR